MDDEETEVEVKLIPRLHNRWSLLVWGLDFASDIAMVVATQLTVAVNMAAQHAVQKSTDHEFSELMK